MGQLNQFIPHGYCMSWNMPLLTLHVLSDALIALAYFSIPIGLVYVAKRRGGGSLQPVYYLFAAFILACGCTHIMGIVTLWYPDYYISGLIKLITAAVSLATALYLIPKLPMVLSLPNLDDLVKINGQLTEENARRKEVEKALRETTNKALASQHAQADFLANMSHEIRTPLNGVLGALNLLRETEVSETQKELVDVSYRSAQSLLGLINDILDASKIESGNLTLRETEIDLAELVGSVAKTMQVEAENKDLELICPTGWLPDTPYLGDEVRLRQIILNLVGNAVKFTQHGQVSLKVTRLSTDLHESEFLFEIIDTGSGLSESAKQQIFERFRQTENTVAVLAKGSGLGLAISKQLVDLMGGEIGVSSEEGKGSNFWFRVRLKRALKPPKVRSYTNDFLQGTRVVVSSPVSAMKDYLNSVLGEMGARIEVFSQLSELLKFEFALTERPELVLMDRKSIDLEGGVESSIARLREAVPGIKVICLTTQTDNIREVERLEPWVDALLIKPLVQEELLNQIRAVLHAEMHASKPVATEPERVLSFKGAKVLLVDDHPINQKVAKATLERMGLAVDVASNGQEAINRLAEVDYQLVFMDCEMPVMNGFEATEQIRSAVDSVQNPDVPIVALTAKVMPEDIERCLNVGMNDWVGKPFQPKRLKHVLAKWLSEYLVK